MKGFIRVMLKRIDRIKHPEKYCNFCGMEFGSNKKYWGNWGWVCEKCSKINNFLD